MPYEQPKYIVENIECMQGAEGDLWVTSFQGKKTTLTEKVKPTWDIGDELPFKPKLIKPTDGSRWYYVRPLDGEAPKPTKTYQKQEKTYKADPAKIDSMEYSNARNLAVQMYCQITEQGTPANWDLLDSCFRHITALGKDLVSVAKEQYGAVEQ